MEVTKITFQANEQELVKTGGVDVFASDTVSYIEAEFTLGTNWQGYDSVRAMWKFGSEVIATVLDYQGKCIVPWEVLTKRGELKVNLVGSISENDVLTDRLTTFPILALVISKIAQVEGDNSTPPTASEYEQFVEDVHADADRAEQAMLDAQTAQGLAEEAQTASETAQGLAEQARDDAQTAQGKAEDAERGAERAKENVESYALKSEGYAVGRQNGQFVSSDSPYYHNNSKYFSEQASASAGNASTSEGNAHLSEVAAGNAQTAAETAQRYAEGARDSAQAYSLVSEGYANGKQNGEAVTSESPYYENNAEYFKDEAWNAVASLDLGLSVVNGAINITYEV